MHAPGWEAGITGLVHLGQVTAKIINKPLVTAPALSQMVELFSRMSCC